jgi:hypothetical protein
MKRKFASLKENGESVYAQLRAEGQSLRWYNSIQYLCSRKNSKAYYAQGSWDGMHAWL